MGKYGIMVCPAYSGSGGCEVGTGYLATEPQFREPDFTLPPIPMDRADGYQMGDVTTQGVRAYDPSTALWVSPDAYAGTITDPGSQKPFMWNGNNPVAYGDPSGYYIFDNGTEKQKESFAKAAKAVDKKVLAKMSGLSKSSALYQRLAAIHHDLQPGAGRRHIEFKSLDRGTMGQTSFNIANLGIAVEERIVSMGPASIDPSQNKTLDQYMSTIVSEGGIYETGSGNLGPSAHASLLESHFENEGGVTPVGHPNDTDSGIDMMINSEFNAPLGVGLDNG